MSFSDKKKKKSAGPRSPLGRKGDPSSRTYPTTRLPQCGDSVTVMPGTNLKGTAGVAEVEWRRVVKGDLGRQWHSEGKTKGNRCHRTPGV